MTATTATAATCAITGSTVGQHDVLLGRDKTQHRHPGNRRFRDLVQEFRVEYQQSILREGKKRIAETIISIVVANGGRFLKQDDDTEHGSMWSEVSEDVRYKKVCHALRSAKARRSSSLMENSMDTSSRWLSQSSLFSITTSQEEQRQQEEGGEEAVSGPRMNKKLQNVEVESAAVLIPDTTLSALTPDTTLSAAPMVAADTTLKCIQPADPSVAAATLSDEPDSAAASNNRVQVLLSEQHNILQTLSGCSAALEMVDIGTVFDNDVTDDDFSVIRVDDQTVFHDDDMQRVLGDCF